MLIDRVNDRPYNQLIKMSLRIRLIIIFSLLFSSNPGVVFAQETANSDVSVQKSVLETGRKIVKAVEVKGNKTIGMAMILSKVKTRAGQAYLQSIISDDLKRLYNTGYFSDVSVDRQEYAGGFRVIFYVVEKSIVEKVSFSHIRYLKPKSLSRKIKTKKGKFLDSKSLRDDVRTIKELYEKKGLTKATVDVEKEIDALTNKARVHFVIKEGTRVKVKRIWIEGNESYRDKKILRVIKTRPDSLFTSGYLKEDLLEEDMDRIRSFYEQKGYIDATADYILEPLSISRLVIKIKIYEGKQYFVEDISIVGNKVASREEIIGVMKEVEKAKIFSRSKLKFDVANVRAMYFDKGYIFARVRESTSLNPEKGEVQIRLDIDEGELAYINRIKVQGNTRTRDIVVRRELQLYPGDQFDGAKLRRSKERLTNLGYFEDISYDIEDVDTSDRKNLIVQVKEAKTGSFSFGGGYSTVDQVVGFVEIEQKNFDFTSWPTFTGGGQDLLLRAETGSTRNNMQLSFTEPWLFDYPISAGFDAYIMEKEREKDVGFAYDEKRVGGNIRFGKQFTDYISSVVTYRREEIEIDNFDEDVSAAVLAEEGENTISSLGFSLTRDSRDSVFSPTKGLYLNGAVDVAGGFLGGDRDFIRLSARTSYNIPWKFDSVLEFRLRAGVVDAYDNSSAVPIFEKFFAGGAKTIRGYDERKVGPLDDTTKDPVGGESLLVGNIEYTIPVIEFIKFATFFDVGNVWPRVEDFGGGDLRYGTGLGLRIKTPIGPVSLDYGYPLSDEPGEESQSGKFYFSISRGF